VRALLANAGLFAGFWLLGSRLGCAFFNSCDHVISFGGGFRDHIDHSDAVELQVNSTTTRSGDGLAMTQGMLKSSRMSSDVTK
jgi:hypothetical protein